jgi:histidine triad (HIT) family protein
MFNHAPLSYICPICVAISGKENNDTLIRQSDVVYKDNLVTVFISSFFIGKNSGTVIVTPNKHYENIYDLPQKYSSHIARIAQLVAIAIKKTYKCGGISILQNNEPAGNQHAFHYHLNIFPRYENDDLHKNMLDKKTPTPEERKLYAEKLKAELSSTA